MHQIKQQASSFLQGAIIGGTIHTYYIFTHTRLASYCTWALGNKTTKRQIEMHTCYRRGRRQVRSSSAAIDSIWTIVHRPFAWIHITYKHVSFSLQHTTLLLRPCLETKFLKTTVFEILQYTLVMTIPQFTIPQFLKLRSRPISLEYLKTTIVFAILQF
jgi:hypothetical protein